MSPESSLTKQKMTPYSIESQAQQWKLMESVVSTTGAIFASYVLDGEVKLDPLSPDKVFAKSFI